MALSEELKVLYSSGGDDVTIQTLELKHYLWEQSFYVVNQYTDFTAFLEGGIQEVTFNKYSFSIIGPDKNSNGVQTLEVRLDAVNRELIDLLEIANSDENNIPITLIYREYIDSDTSGPQNDPPIELTLGKVVVNKLSASGQAESKNLSNKKFATDVYTSAYKSLTYVK
jgi:hypothetical protein